MGRAIKIVGLGPWTPNIGLDGRFDLRYRAGSVLTDSLNIAGTFNGRILHRENIGLTGDELAAKRNNDHPEDPLIS